MGLSNNLDTMTWELSKQEEADKGNVSCKTKDWSWSTLELGIQISYEPVEQSVVGVAACVLPRTPGTSHVLQIVPNTAQVNSSSTQNTCKANWKCSLRFILSKFSVLFSEVKHFILHN